VENLLKADVFVLGLWEILKELSGGEERMRISGQMILFLVLGVFLSAGFGVTALLSVTDRGVTTELPEEERITCIGEELAEMVNPDDVPRTPPGDKRAQVPSQVGDDWVLRDTVSACVMIPAGQCYAVQFDHRSGSLEAISPEEELSDVATSALAKAPKWLYDDLKDSFLRLGDLQETYANLIVNAQDPYIDEIAFQVAHIAPETLADPQVFLYLHMLVENAELLYEIDQYLDYVDIVEAVDIDDPTNYYSTTSYRVVSDGDTALVAIPKEYYYWYIVHPKISDEDVKMTDEPSDRQATYGYFWREYLFFDPSVEFSYTEGGYPLLKDCLDSTRVFWDGLRYDLPYGRPFGDQDMALDVIGNWATRVVPQGAYGNRPIQPNQIACEHNGNCGELQDLLCAAARTALIPTLCTMDICEDHVWTEFYWDGSWHPYQVDLGGGGTHIDNPGIAYDRDHGGGKQVSAIWNWRPDGYNWATTGRYSNCCMLIATVCDFNGNPVDGARVRLYAEPIWGGDLYVTTWGYTGSDGRCEFELGDHRDIYARVQSPLGDYPMPSGAVVKIIDMSQTGQIYYKPFTVPGVIEGFQAHEAEVPQDPWNGYKVEINLDVPREMGYGMNLYDGNTFAQEVSPGRVDFLLCDSLNYAHFVAGELFQAREISYDLTSMDLTFQLPTEGDWYLVFSSQYMVTNTVKASVSVDLFENLTTFIEAQMASTIPRSYLLSQNFPNPFNPRTEISYRLPRRARVLLNVYNQLGQKVKTLVDGEIEAGHHTVSWDGKDERGRMVSSGVYFYRFLSGEFAQTRKMVLLR
jgi:hypothetical protein